jgi:hypothetical protein
VLKKDILNTIRRAFSMTRIAKELFRETGGFLSLVSVLVGFEGGKTKIIIIIPKYSFFSFKSQF